MNYTNAFIYDKNSHCFASVFKLRGPQTIRHMWNLIGGKIDAGEPPHIAHDREVLEETGISLMDSCRYVGGFDINMPECSINIARYDVTKKVRPALPTRNDVEEPLTWMSLAPEDMSQFSFEYQLGWIIPLLLGDIPATGGQINLGQKSSGYPSIQTGRWSEQDRQSILNLRR